MRILFIIDKIELKYFEFNNLVTNFWMIKEFLKRGQEVQITTISNLLLRGKRAYAKCYESFLDKENICYKDVIHEELIDNFDMVLFRPDPPVDIDYINATYVFDFVTKPAVINSPAAIRDFNEKLHSLKFSEYMTDCIVTSSLKDIEDFLKAYDFNKYFVDHLCYGDLKLEKYQNILYLKNKYQIDEVIYVGDTLKDYKESSKAGVKFIHAAYGFGKIDHKVHAINSLNELEKEITKVFNE